MRKIVIPLLLLLCVYSCQKEDSILEEEATQTPITQKDFSIPNNNYSPREIMEINLRWTAFIAGSVLRNSTQAQNEVAALLQNGNQVIKLSDLFIENTAFYNGFRGYLVANFSGGDQIEPHIDKTRPNPPPQGIGGGESDVNSTNNAAFANFFINYILTENCIELYFPKSMSYREQYSITSTGHSMNDKEFNDGIIRYYEDQWINDVEQYGNTEDVLVNRAYVESNKNIIIARPYRTTGVSINGLSCSYSQYDDISDFTYFLKY